MTNFELIQEHIQRIKEMEDDLKYLRETSEPATIEAIDNTLSVISVLYINFMKIDKALEDDKTGYVLF